MLLGGCRIQVLLQPIFVTWPSSPGEQVRQRVLERQGDGQAADAQGRQDRRDRDADTVQEDQDPDTDGDAAHAGLNEPARALHDGRTGGEAIENAARGAIDEHHERQDDREVEQDVESAVPLRRERQDAIEDDETAGHDGDQEGHREGVDQDVVPGPRRPPGHSAHGAQDDRLDDQEHGDPEDERRGRHQPRRGGPGAVG
ncbi:MAG: hypothetical protein AUI52_06840 [Acidobacteria bacterium 13_1_40CM_2_68_10]|nr:MAG: hypothetical protein AUI52_06840 [Acidobacteria bacterium 13_1_40CM_2_68_10]